MLWRIFQKTLTRFIQGVEGAFPFGDRIRHVGDHLDVRVRSFIMRDLDERITVGQRRRLVGDDDDDTTCGVGQATHSALDAGTKVDDHIIIIHRNQREFIQ